MRKISILSLIMLLIFSMTSVAFAVPKVVLDNQTLTFEVSPVIEKGRTLVPLRAIFEALGAEVLWEGSTNTVTALKDGTEIKLTIGGSAYKNGAPVNLEVPAKIISSRTMVPLRFVSESLGCQVAWNGTTETITITSVSGDTEVKVHFIDVGQADSIYIEMPNGDDILIDAGNKGDGPSVVSYLKAQGVDDIELLIATHPHEDHIGGLPYILEAFSVEKIIDSGKTSDTGIYKEYEADAKAEGAAWTADSLQSFTFGNSILQVLTGAETWTDINDYSVVCRLDTGNIEFLFTGDAEGPAEGALTGTLEAEVLKVGHHGSLSSSATSFLSNVKPDVAIISVGTGNTYGHPVADTLSRLQKSGATIYRTDLNGNIVITTDGKTYNVNTSRNTPAATPALPVVQPPQQQVPLPVPAVTTEKYVGSTKSDKYHYPSCRYAEKISPENIIWFKDANDAKVHGYQPCGVCKP